MWGILIALKPTMPEVVVHLGNAYLKRIIYRAALQVAKKILELTPDRKKAFLYLLA